MIFQNMLMKQINKHNMHLRIINKSEIWEEQSNNKTLTFGILKLTYTKFKILDMLINLNFLELQKMKLNKFSKNLSKFMIIVLWIVDLNLIFKKFLIQDFIRN